MSTEQKPDMKVVVRDAPDGVFKAYSNQINITWNVFDLRFHFGDSTVIADQDNKVTVDTKAVITVAWAEAKQISDILQEVIRRFETANGEIKKVSELRIAP